MSHSSSVSARKRRSSRSRGRNRPPQRSRVPAIRFALVVIAACGVIATGTYFAFRDDVFTRSLIDGQTKISSKDRISDLRAQVDRLATRLDRDWLRAAKLKEFTNDLRSKAQNGSTASDPPPPSPVETPSEAIVATAQTIENAMVSNKKPHASNRRHARVNHKPTQGAPTVAGGNNTYAEPARTERQNYY